MTPAMPADVPVDTSPAVVTVSAAQSPAPTILVKSHGYRYEVIGNTLLKQEVIETWLQEAADPKAALAALNQAYKKAGYFLVVLRGIVSGKTVSIQVIEGRLTESKISPDLEGYFSGLEGREGLTRSDVLSRTAMAELYAARQGLRPKVNFEPAQEVGGSKMTVTEEPLENAKFWNANLGFGNYGNRYSSRFLLQSGAALRPGGGLELTANYTHGVPNLNSESVDSNYNEGNVGTSIVTPWGIYGVSYDKIRYRLGKITEPLYPEGDIDTWNATGSQLLYADAARRWGVNEGLNHTANEYKGFPGSPAEYRIIDQKYGFVSLGTTFAWSFQAFGENASLSSNLTVSKGISGRSGTFLPVTPVTPDPAFTLVAGNVGYTQGLPGGYSAGASLTGQWTDSTLPQNQQWVLGGYGNLTAWFPGVVVGDDGLLTRVSVSTPSWVWGPASLSVTGFLEAGYSRYHLLDKGLLSYLQYSQFLSDVGIGLSASLTLGTSLTLGFAQPLKTHGIDQAFLDDNRAYLYFNLIQAF